MKTLGQEAAEKINEFLQRKSPATVFVQNPIASIIDKIIEERGLVPAGASLPQGQTRVGKCIGRAHDEQDAIDNLSGGDVPAPEGSGCHVLAGNGLEIRSSVKPTAIATPTPPAQNISPVPKGKQKPACA